MSDSFGETAPDGRPLGTVPAPPQPMGEASANTRDVAADEAKGVAQDAKASAQQVTGTAKEQASDVVSEVQTQARAMFAQTKQELGGQAGAVGSKAAQGLHALADEFQEMLRASNQSGIASDLAGQAQDRTRQVAAWLENREPGEILEDVAEYARRKPGTFLAAAAVVGFLGGRMMRSLTGDDSQQSGSMTTSRPMPVSRTARVTTTVSQPSYATGTVTVEPAVTMPASGSATGDPLLGTPVDDFADPTRPRELP